MPVKPWNTFCRKINKERLETETMSSWKPGRRGGGGDAGLVLRGCQTHPAELRGQGGGLAEGRKLGAGAVKSDVIIKHMR